MLRVTKIFHFETAHAIYQYQGACANIHGHSYRLCVTVASGNETGNDLLTGQGFVIDFRDLKRVVAEIIQDVFDHKVILSRSYLDAEPELKRLNNLVTWEAEPSAENMLIFLARCLENKFPPELKLIRLKLYETKDSYAEWECRDQYI